MPPPRKHFLGQSSSENFAFTLAEVLITIGIIGIVATLIMPTVIENYQKKTTALTLKKFYSNYSQALQLSEIEHGDISTWNLAEVGGFDDVRNIPFLTEYLFKYMNPLEICETRTNWKRGICATDITLFGNSAKRILFQDGSCMGLTVNGNSVISGTGGNHAGVIFTIIYDTNCNNKPNKVGRDQFYFISNWSINKKINKDYYPLSPFSNTTNTQKYKNSSRDTLKNLCKSNKSQCASLIKHDNWEIKDDYPW